MPKGNKLTPKEEKFIDVYIEEGNATEAGAQAYEVKNRAVAAQIGYENLRKPDIKEAIEVKKLDLAQQIQAEAVTAFKVMMELLSTSQSDRLRADIARDIMDRAGYRPPEKRELSGPNGGPIDMQSRHTQEIAQRARELLTALQAPQKELSED